MIDLTYNNRDIYIYIIIYVTGAIYAIIIIYMYVTKDIEIE